MYIISNIYIQARYKKLCLVSRLCGRDKTMFYGYNLHFSIVLSTQVTLENITLRFFYKKITVLFTLINKYICKKTKRLKNCLSGQRHPFEGVSTL